MEFTNSLTEHLKNIGILDENASQNFSKSYYDQKNISGHDESDSFEDTAIFTLTCYFKNLSSDQAHEISKRIYNNWQEAEEIRFLTKIEKVIGIYQRNKIAYLKQFLRKWLNNAQAIQIEEIASQNSILKEELSHLGSIRGDDTSSHIHIVPESENIPNYKHGDNLESPIATKSRSVMDILSSRNLRNRSKSAKRKNKDTKMTLSEIDEDFTRDPPKPHNPFQDCSFDRSSMTQKMDFSRDLSQERKTPIYDRLHEDAKIKEAKQREYEILKKEEEEHKCTFKPAISKSASRPRDRKRFSKLAISTKNERERMYKIRRESKEIEGCTFQPNTSCSKISLKNSCSDVGKSVFDKLYEEKESKQKYMRNLKIEDVNSKQFSSTYSFTNNSFGSISHQNSDGEVFKRLFSEHEELKRKRVKMELSKKLEEENKYSFKPERVTKQKDKEFGLDYSDEELSKDPAYVYEKLYRDAEINAYKLNSRQKAAEREIQERSHFSSLNYRTTENRDPNFQGQRFEKLYQDRDKSVNRLKEVTQKVMKEEGCSFKPRTNKKFNNNIKSDIISRNNEFITKKHENLEIKTYQIQNEHQYHPRLISNQHYTSKQPSPVADRLYNKASEYEMKKERLRRDQVDQECTFKPKLAKMTDQILISKSIFSHH
ncbi:unnamed protein product [Moneuplotes crassus]|uniref:Uncharacterized protein n=1 Tax=Euplotes crassus TaxID=5936 RepID=A0AAD1X2U3_EUPCR|nr:unnamed protein product [Moneuplotes crassus]